MIEDKSKHVILAQHGPAEQGSVGTKCQSHWEATWIQNGRWGWLLCSLFPSLWIFSTKNFAIHGHSTSTSIVIPIFRAKNVCELGAPSCDKRISQLQARFLSWPLAFSQSFYWHSKVKTLYIYIYIYNKYIVRASPPQACKHPFSLNLGPG
jgi:hypothetical protein